MKKESLKTKSSKSVVKPPRKTYIVDTNVLLSDPESLFAFAENEVILPLTVIEEVDKNKTKPSEAGANARETARKLADMIKTNPPGTLKTGLTLKNGGLLRIVSIADLPDTGAMTKDWDETSKDNHILHVCYGLSKQAKKEGKPAPIFVTRDILLRVKCDFLEIPCEDYKKSSVADNPDRIFTGTCTADVPPEVIQAFFEATGPAENNTEFDCIVDSYIDHQLSPNEFITLKGEDDAEEASSAVVRYIDSNKPLKLVKQLNQQAKKPVFGLVPRNKEQTLAMELLLDDSIRLVTLIGKAGSGKTLLSVAAGLHLVLEKKKYKSLVVCRPVVPVGNDLGYLPGPVPLHTKVLTPDGWKMMGSIEKNSFVIARDGTPTKVLQTFAKGQKEIIEITFEDGVKIECCEDHPWSVYKTNNTKARVLQTKSIEKIQNENGWDKKWWNRLFIDLVEPVVFSPLSKPLPIHPYVLGSILGDGCVTAKYANEFSTSDQESIERINSLLDPQMTLSHKSGQSYSFSMKANIGNVKRVNNKLTEAINGLGLRGKSSRTKFIPKEYLFSSISERFSLLRGLMDTDGYCSKDGSDVSYTTTSKLLADDFKSLVMSLGGMAKVNYSENKFQSYTISVSFSKKEDCPFSLTRKSERWKPRKNRMLRRIESVKRTGVFAEMKCIAVENPEHLYVMDHFVVTHNSKQEKLEPWIAPIKDNLRHLLFSGRKGKQNEETLQNYFDNGVIEVEAITYLRGRSIADALIIIDEAQNLTAHELKTIITRVGDNTKIILTGDVEQIDNMYIDSVSNGLAIAVEKFKPFEIAAHITLVKGERSELATLAASLL